MARGPLWVSVWSEVVNGSILKNAIWWAVTGLIGIVLWFLADFATTNRAVLRHHENRIETIGQEQARRTTRLDRLENDFEKISNLNNLVLERLSKIDLAIERLRAEVRTGRRVSSTGESP